jgi:hypothetical protein
MFHVQAHIRRITHRLTEAIAQIKAADTDAITGGALVSAGNEELLSRRKPFQQWAKR